MNRRFAPLALIAVLGAGCGAGPYGHSRVYSPLGPEGAALSGAREFDPVMAKRMPDKWLDHKVSVFGVVVERKDLGGGKVDLLLSLRALEPRNLCESSDEDSCRVTVSDREFDRLHATVAVTDPADRSGPISIGVASLIRVVGAYHDKDGGEVTATYYRHFPRGYYVTTRSASLMRQ